MCLKIFFQYPSKWIEQLKIIRDATPNQYMVLLKFQCQVS